MVHVVHAHDFALCLVLWEINSITLHCTDTEERGNLLFQSLVNWRCCKRLQTFRTTALVTRVITLWMSSEVLFLIRIRNIGRRPTGATSTVNKRVSLDIKIFLHHISRAFLFESYKGWSHIKLLTQWLFTIYMKSKNQ